MFRSNLDLKQLEQNLTEATISTPEFGKYGEINDRFAFGAPSAMEAYGRRRERLMQHVVASRRTLHAEIYLEEYLGLTNQTNVDSSILSYRVKADGRVESHTA